MAAPKKLELEVEELEERIAPGLIGVNPPGQVPGNGPPPPGHVGNNPPGQIPGLVGNNPPGQVGR